MQIVEVKFKAVGDIKKFADNNDIIQKDDDVIVEDEGMLKYGIVIKTQLAPESETQYDRVVRKASAKDIEQVKQNLSKAKYALEETKKIAKKQMLDMKVISAEYTFDTSKLVICFTSDNRVDFRELVKSLAGMFKTRIELRQIGVRDEAKILGGMGPCGRQLCCANHLSNFEKVSIKMAKNQGLSLNPAGISGACDRYMCCLAYEDEYYASTLAKMPKLNSKVKTPNGEGVCSYNNVLKQTVTVKFLQDDGSFKFEEFGLGEIKFGNTENQ